METAKFISLSDSYIDVEGGEKKVAQYIADISNGKLMMVLSTKSIPKNPVKLTKKTLEKYLK